jgi:hypothetical protein
MNNVYKNLSQIPHTEVYGKENIPERYHYKSNPRIGDIIIIVDPGYELHRRSSRMIILLFRIFLFSILK